MLTGNFGMTVITSLFGSEVDACRVLKVGRPHLVTEVRGIAVILLELCAGLDRGLMLGTLKVFIQE